MQNELVTYRAKSFAAETNKSSMAYEVKRTRAVWDDGLAIPGTNRRGGWRCPPGTRYGGQITDRFGRNCGWGVSRRLANEISDLGERLENIGERRQRRREQRAVRRQGRGPGVVERAAGRVARALETEETITPEAPQRPRRQRQGVARRRNPNLRSSEDRRMQREIDQPGAQRTEPGRRRQATADVVDRPRPVAPVAQPAKKAPAKKAAAKKKAPAKKAPAKKRVAKKQPAKKTPAKKTPAMKAPAARKLPQGWSQGPGSIITHENGDIIDQEPAFGRWFVVYGRPARTEDGFENREDAISWHKENVLDRAAQNSQPDWDRFGGLQVGDGIRWNDLDAVLGDLYRNERWGDIEERKQRDAIVAENNQRLINRLSGESRSIVVDERNTARANATRWRGELEEAMLAFENEPDAARRKVLAKKIYDSNENLRASSAKLKAISEYLQNRPATAPPEPERVQTSELPPINPLRTVFAGRSRGFERDWPNERQRILDLPNDFSGMDENRLVSKLEDFNQNIQWNEEYLRNLEALNPNQRIQLPNRVVKAGDLKQEVQGVVNAWQSLRDGANARLIEINNNRLPGLHGVRPFNRQNLEGFNTVEIARNNMDALVGLYPGTRFNILNHNGKFFVISQDQLDRARLNGLDNPRVIEHKGGLPLANELPPIDSDVARQAKERVNQALQKRQDVLAIYLNERYGEGNAPWKEMTAERRLDLSRRAARGDADAKRELVAWAKEMYNHTQINGTNGETYRNLATARYNGDSISVSLEIQRKNADGSWTKVGYGSRTIYHTSVPAHVYNNRLEVSEKRSKNSGIQTIINQHAFMYAKASGFEYFGVSAIDDGPYVWGRIGFTERISPTQASRMNDEIAKFRAGQNSIIKNETDARILEHLIGEYVRDPDKVRHIDFISALSIEGSGQVKKARDKELRDWFVVNMKFSSGKLNLEENNISADPRDRVRA